MDIPRTVWRIEMLGGLRARYGGLVLERFQTRKTEALLAYLALYPGRRHSRETLITLLWPDAEPEAGRNRLSQAVAWLRPRLEPEEGAKGSILLADRQSIGFASDAVITDVTDFEAALETATKTHEASTTLQALQQAVALYRGDFLIGQYDDWIVAESQRLRERFLTALRLLLRQYEEQGKTEQSLATARRLVTLEPMSEEAHHDVIRFLVASGQTDAARRQLRDLERILKRELGRSPSAATRALFETVSERTAEREIVVPSVSPILPTPTLPTALTRFIGRDAEIVQVQHFIEANGARLVTLLGTGGTGKTRLAVEIARRLTASFHNAIWFVPLAEVNDARAIPSALAEAVRAPRQETAPLEPVIAALTAQVSLLILDNLEHLADDAAPIVNTLLQRVPTLKILVTSRQRLGLEGEREVFVPPLSTPKIAAPQSREAVRLPTLQEMESVRLFVDRAQLVRTDFALRDDNADTIARLCERLEGIPLAIELCAAWAQTLTPAQMLTKLTHRFDLLVSRRKDIPARHRTLRAALEYSYLLLPPDLQQLFTRLSVFRGGWSLDAAAHVCLDGVDSTLDQVPIAALELLTELRERSLIVAEENARHDGAEMRYRMLETLREFAAEQQTLSIEVPLRRQHAEYFQRLSHRAEGYLAGPAQSFWLARLEAEHDNFRAALAWAVENQTREIGWSLGASLATFWEMRGFSSEGQEWLERLLRLPGDGTDEGQALRAKALNGLARLARSRGQFAVADAAVQEALSLSRALGNRRHVAASLQILATLAYSHEDYTGAQYALKEALALAREADDSPLVAGALTNLGNVAMELCDWPQARALYGEALELHRREQDRKRVADVLNNLGLVARYQGDYDTARRYLEEDLEIGRELANPSSIGIALLNLGTVHRLQGRFLESRHVLEEAARLAFEVDNKRALAWCVKELGHLACAEGNFPSGVRLLAASEHLRRLLGMSFKPADPEELERDTALAKAVLQGPNFANAWSEGEELQFDEAYRSAVGVLPETTLKY